MIDHQYEYFKALCEEQLRASELSAQSAQYWTLAQAAAWVMFRDTAVVARFTPPRADNWAAFLLYVSTYLIDFKKSVVEPRWHGLFVKLEANLMRATGRRASDGIRESIPPVAWSDLVRDVDAGPYISLVSDVRAHPWTDLLVLRADVERLWRRPSEVDDRSKYDRQKFRDLFAEQRERDPELSANAIIDKVSRAFEEKTNRVAPSFSSFKRYVRGI